MTWIVVSLIIIKVIVIVMKVVNNNYSYRRFIKKKKIKSNIARDNKLNLLIKMTPKYNDSNYSPNWWDTYNISGNL